MKISIIDDMTWAVVRIAESVRAAGYEAIEIPVLKETTLDEVMLKIEGSDLVILDHNMYDFSGEDIAKRLGGKIPLVTVSDHGRAKVYSKHYFPWREKLAANLPSEAAEQAVVEDAKKELMNLVHKLEHQ